VSTDRESTLDANRYVHSTLVETGEYQRSPHFRPENVRKVRGWLENIAADIPGLSSGKAIDFGCGTGFMIDRLQGLVGQIHGIDTTRAMIEKVDVSSGNVHLHECLAEETPFPPNVFLLGTAYSFMDHLHDVSDFLKEVHRVLKPGGVFFAGLNPNRAFIHAMESLAQAPTAELHPVYGRELTGALRNGQYYMERFGIDERRLEDAEPGKTLRKGFDPQEICDTALSIGFRRCETSHDWFLGQGNLMHEHSMQNADLVERYLRTLLPFSAPYFKYLNFTLHK
jgi:SAM-dependent methyltransferase